MSPSDKVTKRAAEIEAEFYAVSMDEGLGHAVEQLALALATAEHNADFGQFAELPIARAS